MCEGGMPEYALCELLCVPCLPYPSCSLCQHLYSETQVSSSAGYEIAQVFQVMFLAPGFYFPIIKEIPNYVLLFSAVSFIG